MKQTYPIQTHFFVITMSAQSVIHPVNVDIHLANLPSHQKTQRKASGQTEHGNPRWNLINLKTKISIHTHLITCLFLQHSTAITFQNLEKKWKSWERSTLLFEFLIVEHSTFAARARKMKAFSRDLPPSPTPEVHG